MLILLMTVCTLTLNKYVVIGGPQNKKSHTHLQQHKCVH